MFIIRFRTFFFWLTGLILVAAVASICIFGLPLSIDFTGGSLVEVSYTSPRPDLATLNKALAPLALGPVSILDSGANDVTLRSRTLTPAENTAVLAALSEQGAAPLTEVQFNSIGPSLGSELATKSLYALLAVVAFIVLYIAWAFRSVPKPVPGWGYGIVVVVMLAIDLIVPTGFYAALCHYTGAQVDSLFVVAILALLGYCVNDVIVIFDRIRENLTKNDHAHAKEEFTATVGRSIDETMTRSINTALTVALALVARIMLGTAATRDFALVMLVGVVIGTFSSVCRSAPLLIPLADYFTKKEHEEKSGSKKSKK
jgi:preprotein translocase subunit SecF